MSEPVEALAAANIEVAQPTAGSSPQSIGSRSERITSLVSAVEWRRVTSSEDLEAVELLRYQCYLREGAIRPNETLRLGDRFDLEPRTSVFAFFIQGRLIASIRVHVLDSVSASSPTFLAFPDAIEPMIAAGHQLIDSSRFVIDAQASHTNPLLPFVVLRMPALLMVHALSTTNTQVEIGALAAVRTEHIPFYSRFLRMRQIREPRPYLQLTKPLGLCYADCNRELPKVLALNPFLIPRPEEMTRLMSFV